MYWQKPQSSKSIKKTISEGSVFQYSANVHWKSEQHRELSAKTCFDSLTYYIHKISWVGAIKNKYVDCHSTTNFEDLKGLLKIFENMFQGSKISRQHVSSLVTSAEMFALYFFSIYFTSSKYFTHHSSTCFGAQII